MIEHWDGDDFPRFVNQLFEDLSHIPKRFINFGTTSRPRPFSMKISDAYGSASLRGGKAPNDSKTIGNDIASSNTNSFVCDLLSNPSPLLDQMQPEPNAIVWWSNAFFTMYGNWRCCVEDRQTSYERWIEQLARLHNPDLYLGGIGF